MEYQHIRSAAARWFGLLRVNEARSTDTTEQRLRELATDPMRPVRVCTARNPNTPPQLRDELTAAGVCPERLCGMAAELFRRAEFFHRRAGVGVGWHQTEH